MPKPTFADKKRQQTVTFANQLVTEERQQQVKQLFESGQIDADQEFIRRQSKSQQDFYGIYEKRWSIPETGHLVEPPQYVDPVEQEIQNTKLGYFDRKKRVNTAKSSYGMWLDKLREYNTFDQATKVTDVDEDMDLIEAKRTLYGLRFDETNKPQAQTYDLMKSTVRLAVINKKKNEIFEAAMAQKQDLDPMVKAYISEIIALGPELVANQGESLSDPITITEESISNFTEYAKKAVQDPVTAIKEAVTDALYSFGDVSTKILDKNAIALKFEKVKHLRDKYKAISTLFAQDEGGDKVLDMIQELRKDEAECPKDNVVFAKALYQRIDMDMRHTLEKNHVGFDNDGSLVDIEGFANATIKKEGGQAAELLTAVKKNVTTERHTDVERYWDRKAADLIMKDEDKAKKKKKDAKRDFTDTYKIAGTVKNLEADKKALVIGEQNKKFFSELALLGSQLALSVYDIDKELEDSKTVFQRREDELKARPELKRQIKLYIDKRRQQLLNLMDRAAGVVNAMKYLAGEVALTANGTAVLKSLQLSMVKPKTEKKKGKKNAEDESADYTEIEFVEEDLIQGTKKDLIELGTPVPNFEEVKRLLVYKFSDHERIFDLVEVLEKAETSRVFDLLTLMDRDVLNMSFEDVYAGLNSAILIQDTTRMLSTFITESHKNIEFLFEKIKRTGLEFQNPTQKTILISEYRKARDKLLAINRLKAAKAPGIGVTYGSLLTEGKDLAQITAMKRDDLISNMQFKIVTDLVEMYRCEGMMAMIQNDGITAALLTDQETREIKKATSRAKQQKDGTYKDGKTPERLAHEQYAAKRAAAINLYIKHSQEFNELKRKDRGLEEKIDERKQDIETPDAYDEGARYLEQLYQRTHQIQDEEEEEREVEQPIVIQQHDENPHNEDGDGGQPPRLDKYGRRVKADVDPEVLKEAFRVDFEEESKSIFKEYDEVPEIQDPQTIEGITKKQIGKFLLEKNMREFNAGSAIETMSAFDQAQGGDPVLADCIKTAFYMLSTKDYAGKLIKDLTEERQQNSFAALTQEEIENLDLTVDQNDPDYLWFVNELAQARTINDIYNLRNTWGRRNDYNKRVLENGTAPALHHKINAFLFALGRAIDTYEARQKSQEISAKILQYKTTHQQEQPDYNLRTDDPQGVYNFDQKQKGTYACWTASHTYVVNTYMAVNGIQAPKFTQATLKDPKNFVTHPAVQHYLEDQNDQNPDSMSFNMEADNIKKFLSKDKMGNPYTMADKVITSIPKTAEHHLVFTNFFLKSNARMTDEVKGKLTEYLMDKVERELMRTKAPISVLRGGHYLSIVGLDRQKKCFLTMNSAKSEANLNEYTELKVSELLEADKFEMVYPEYLGDENLAYLKGRFGLKDDLYDANGGMNVDENIRAQKQVFLEQPQNMLHVNGYEFDMTKEHYEHEFEDGFVNEQIYMPSHLDLPRILREGQ